MDESRTGWSPVSVKEVKPLVAMTGLDAVTRRSRQGHQTCTHKPLSLSCTMHRPQQLAIAIFPRCWTPGPPFVSPEQSNTPA